MRPERVPVPAGWDDWNGSIDPSTYRYYDFVLNENGHARRFPPGVYQTDAYTDLAVSKIREAATRPGPFFLDVAFLAPHAVERETSGLDRVDEAAVGYARRRHGIRYPVPAPRYRNRFRHARLPRTTAFDQRDVSRMPANIQERPRFTRSEIADIRTDYRLRLASLLSVDDAVGRIVDAFRETGALDNTVIIFTSDNGYFHGEHRIPFGKYLPYEPSIRVPLIVRGPSIASGVTTSALASNVDLAPTILQLAGATPLRTPDGRSLLPVLQRPTAVSVHREVLLESGKNDVGAPVYHGIRTSRWKYVVYEDGDRELYDLARDPSEVDNLAGRVAWRRSRPSWPRSWRRSRAARGPAARRGRGSVGLMADAPKSFTLSPEVHRYLLAHGSQPDDVQRALIERTREAAKDFAGMQIAPEQGAFMTMITRLIGARNAIEVGTFTGYSALCIARGLPDDGHLLCCDVSEEWTAIGREHWEKAGVADKIELRIAPAIETLRALPRDGSVDLAFIDADKTNYASYYEEILARLRPNGLILVDNTLWGGRVLDDGDQSADTVAIRAFNDAVAGDERVDCVHAPDLRRPHAPPQALTPVAEPGPERPGAEGAESGVRS